MTQKKTSLTHFTKRKLAMRFFIRCKHFALSEAVRERIRLRLASILARFAGRVGNVTTSLADLNGTKRGVDKQCRMVVRLRPKGKVTIEQRDRDLFAAIARAADRIKRNVARTLERRRDAKGNRNGFRPRDTEPLRQTTFSHNQ